MNQEAADLWERAGRALKTAEDWSEEDPDASVSRSYYAAFYAVSALFVVGGRTFAKHAAVEAAVHRDLVKSGRWDPSLGRAYSELVILRQTGDYGGGTHVSVEEAREAVAKARRILEAVHLTVDSAT